MEVIAEAQGGVRGDGGGKRDRLQAFVVGVHSGTKQLGSLPSVPEFSVCPRILEFFEFFPNSSICPGGDGEVKSLGHPLLHIFRNWNIKIRSLGHSPTTSGRGELPQPMSG